MQRLRFRQLHALARSLHVSPQLVVSSSTFCNNTTYNCIQFGLVEWRGAD